MPVGIAASGFVGIALETVAGTYTAPTKFVPIRSESLKYQQNTSWRKPIRGLADAVGAVAGYSHVEGDIEHEVFADVIPYFLMASRNTIAKTGTGPYVYTTTPSAAAQAPNKTMSVTVVRNGQVFAYTGCVVSSAEFSQDNGEAIVKWTIMGLDEQVQSVPTPTWANQPVFGAGTYNLQIPTATQVFDVDGFSFSWNDNGAPQYRLANYTKAAYILFGERDIKAHTDRDFIDRTEYEAFKILTAASITLQMQNGSNNIVALTASGAIRDNYDLGGLSGQGNIIRAGVDWVGVYDASSSKAYQVVVTTTENIV